MNGQPEAEVTIDHTLIYELLNHQHPDFAHLPIHPVDAGWDNAMFRLGLDWSVRLPRRAIAAQLIEHEQTWLPYIAPHVSIPVPVPLRIGVPGFSYPWKWSILPWFEGVTADHEAPDPSQAVRFGEFLRSLHQPSPLEAPFNPFRSVSLQERAPDVETRMQRLISTTPFITPTIQQIWQDALAAEPTEHRCWIHGDLHPRNILVNRGAIASIIDWGDLGAGDAATDLASLWMLFQDSHTRQRALDAYGSLSQATAKRAKGWAVFFGVVLLDSGRMNESRQARIGERTLQNLADDGSSLHPNPTHRYSWMA